MGGGIFYLYFLSKKIEIFSFLLILMYLLFLFASSFCEF